MKNVRGKKIKSSDREDTNYPFQRNEKIISRYENIKITDLKIPKYIKTTFMSMKSKRIGNYYILPLRKNDTDDTNDVKCSALTGNYKICKYDVKFFCKDFVSSDNKKHDIYLCTRHLNMLSKDPTNKSPFKNGFYFESDLYKFKKN